MKFLIGKFPFNETVHINGTCFQDIKGHTYMSSDGSVTLNIDFQSKNSLLCGETFILADDSQYFVREVVLE